jgi:hypothetical protein
MRRLRSPLSTALLALVVLVAAGLPRPAAAQGNTSNTATFSPRLRFPTRADADIATPPAGSATLFWNGTNFRFKLPAGTFTDLTGGGGGTPGGADTQVQFNDGGAFGGDADYTWNKTTNVLTLGNSISALLLAVRGATSGTATIDAPATVTSYSFTLPSAVPAAISPLLMETDGDLVFPTGTPDGTKFLRDDGSWAAAGGSITGSDTHVLFFDGANNPAGEAAFTYNKTTNTLAAENFTTSIINGTGGVLQINGGAGTGGVLITGLRGAIATKTTTYAATAEDFTILCDATSGAFDVDLPAAASHTGRVYMIKKVDASANAVSIDPNAAELIDGSATSYTLSVQWAAVTIVSDGTSWFIF